MPRKSLRKYLSKIKRSSPNLPLPSSKRWVLSGCKHPRTPSFAVDNTRNEHGGGGGSEEAAAATLADIDRFLLENFKSLYIKDEEQNEKGKGRGTGIGPDQTKSPREIWFDSPRLVDPPPCLRGSNRFFATPGVTASLIEEAGTSLPCTSTSEDHVGSSSTSADVTLYKNHSCSSPSTNDEPAALPKECIAVLKNSPDPYVDFSRSMQEMVETRLQHHGRLDWDYMEELLFCYLNLNDKKAYRYILSAYTDLVAALRQRERRVPVRSRRTRKSKEGRRKITRREDLTPPRAD
ncbi:hypothetical protein SLE2022_382760 [Rubroshorea leprosula]